MSLFKADDDVIVPGICPALSFPVTRLVSQTNTGQGQAWAPELHTLRSLHSRVKTQVPQQKSIEIPLSRTKENPV